jgi:polysaccharide pyruvyl transferase WcaK-like protein
MTHTASTSGSRPEVLARTTTVSGRLPARHRRGRWLPSARKAKGQIAPKRIGLFGLFGCGNSGNDGSLEAILSLLRMVRPDAEIVCVCGGPDQVLRDFHVGGVTIGFPKLDNRLLRAVYEGPRKLACFARAIRHVRKLDVLLVCGGGALDDFGAPPYGSPLTLFAWCLAARLSGTRLGFVSVGAGPINHPISRWLLKSAASMAQYRSYRDTISKTFLENIGFDTRKDAVYPDLAFRLPVPPSTRTGDEQLAVGVGVMVYRGWGNDTTQGAAVYADYLRKITDFVLWLLDHGHRVRMLTGDVLDRLAVDDVVGGVAAARPHLSRDQLIAEPMYSVHDLMGQIADTDVVVATRFHNVVCALKMCKPTVSIGYTEKNDVLMAEMGLGQFCQHIARLDPELLIEQFTDLISDRSRYDRRMREVNLEYRKALEDQTFVLESCVL